MADIVDSPCINVCRLDARRVCTGCGRTIDEIAGWRGMSDAERRVVVKDASKRRKAASESD
jgi:predicted Fe-S protein YdhL (DUF1289 family)